MRTRETGMTLLELVVVMAILTMFAGLTLPALTRKVQNDAEDQTGKRLETLRTAIRAYARDNLSVPKDLAGLLAPDGTAAWRGPYVPREVQGWGARVADIRKDDWDRPLVYTAKIREEATISSAGNDGVPGTNDDISIVVDVRDILRDITLDRLRTLNLAIRNHHELTRGKSPLPADIQKVVKQLTKSKLLSQRDAWTKDAFGALLITDGSPVHSVHSRHLLNGGDPEKTK